MDLFDPSCYTHNEIERNSINNINSLLVHYQAEEIVPYLDFDIKAAEKSGEIIGRLLSQGTPVNTLDVLIAGTAITSGAERLISRDRYFEKISQVSELAILIY
ncbi:PIN domain-containing protein [Methanotrichaceae archaeon M04Ac]|uniref:PIN domain-containing protein n=1 Tax=Candidatus Methanocrinis alkalitolerans TaxID=3033395 RepID=A0ABT5XGX2_9EURY|nr:PIN domain-containing protein [Candidatus Methanocrinis alkalitolerans]MDF0593971.1 PIN domain-containing protein [Candidatus Methanocrinis alkalitolerans]